MCAKAPDGAFGAGVSWRDVDERALARAAETPPGAELWALDRVRARSKFDGRPVVFGDATAAELQSALEGGRAVFVRPYDRQGQTRCRAPGRPPE